MDYSKVENQIGCGYCDKEKLCNMRTSTENKAKNGCEYFVHFSKEDKTRDLPIGKQKTVN